MRVIAGRFRGRPLSGPPGTATRPITDRVKETLFNVLGHRCATPGWLPDFAVLDVFAGTGSLGIEALSRGARSCVFVERDRAALGALRDNLRCLKIEAICTIRADNAWTLRPPPAEPAFGLIFVDPPYREAEDPLRIVDLLERLAPSLAPDGVLVFRHEFQSAFPVERLGALQLVDERRIGRMRLVFLVRADMAGAPVPTGF